MKGHQEVTNPPKPPHMLIHEDEMAERCKRTRRVVTHKDSVENTTLRRSENVARALHLQPSEPLKNLKSEKDCQRKG